MASRVAHKQRRNPRDVVLMTPDEVCEFLRITRRKLREMTYQGVLHAENVTPRVRRYRESDVLALVQTNKQGGSES